MATKQHHSSVVRWRLVKSGYCWSVIALCVFLLFVAVKTIPILPMAQDSSMRVPVLRQVISTSAGSCSSSSSMTLEEKRPPPEQQQDQCDLFSGRWGFDHDWSLYPLYSERGCAFMNDIVACEKFGRKDLQYQKWRWQPHGCNLPRFNATALLEKLRGKRLVFVGDSLTWNQWVSLICLVESAVPASQKTIHPYGPLKSFHLREYNTSIDHYWAPLLVESNSDNPVDCEHPDRTIRAESIKKHAVHWTEADVIIFNSYHWWRRSKLKVLWGSFDESGGIYREIDSLRSFELALRTWADWVEFNVDHFKTKMFFMGMSPSHSRGDGWGGKNQNCYNETAPIADDGNWGRDSDVRMMQATSSVIENLRSRGVEVQFLNITKLSEYRKDGHPSVYRKQYANLTQKQLSDPSSYADCIHWCLPGVPDVWNEILYAYLVWGSQNYMC